MSSKTFKSFLLNKANHKKKISSVLSQINRRQAPLNLPTRIARQDLYLQHICTQLITESDTS